jgi:hypothetical protein
VYLSPWLKYFESCYGYVSEDGELYLCHRVLDKVFDLPDLDKLIRIKIFNKQVKNAFQIFRLDARYFSINFTVFDIDKPSHYILTKLLNTYDNVWAKLIVKGK